MNPKLKLGLSLFFIGFLGVLTMLTVTIPMDKFPPMVLEKVSPQMLKVLILANPTVLLIISVILGTALYDKVGLKVPNISQWLGIESSGISFGEQFKFGALSGLTAGALIVAVSGIFGQVIEEEMKAMGNDFDVTILARFGYGGITEELLLRYGFMTLIVWVVFIITKNLEPVTYWIGLVLAALLFAVGHFPAVYAAVPEPSGILLTYILIGNSIAGLFFGWLYWKKGLEAAFIAHIFAHVAMLAGEQIFKV